MSEDIAEPSDGARIAALQVGFTALLELMGRQDAEIYQRVVECLHQTGEMAENAQYRRGFRELITMVEGVANPAGVQDDAAGSTADASADSEQ